MVVRVCGSYMQASYHRASYQGSSIAIPMVHVYHMVPWYTCTCILPKHTWFSVHMCALFQSESCDMLCHNGMYVHVYKYNIISKTT